MSLSIVFSLKSNLSAKRIATPPFFWGPLAWKMVFHPFTFSPNVSLGSKWVSYRQQMDGSCLFIQSATLWCFMGAFRAFTLREIIERYYFNDAMLPVKSLFLSIVTFCSVSLLGPFYFYTNPLNISWRAGFVVTKLVSDWRLWKFFMSPSILNDKGSLAACFSLIEL